MVSGVEGVGLRVCGSGFRIQNSGFRVWGVGCRGWGVGIGVQGVRCGVCGVGCGVRVTTNPFVASGSLTAAHPIQVRRMLSVVWGVGLRVWGVGFRVQGLGFRAWGVGCGVWVSNTFVTSGTMTAAHPIQVRRMLCGVHVSGLRKQSGDKVSLLSSPEPEQIRLLP
jgi:hypothetical protein